MRRVSPLSNCLTDLFLEKVEEQPNHIAVVYGNKSLTYKELSENSSDLALYLQYRGVALDDCVGIFVEPSIDLMISIWGTLASGSAYLPLSPEYPDERLKYMIGDSSTKIIITQESLKKRLAQLTSRTSKSSLWMT